MWGRYRGDNIEERKRGGLGELKGRDRGNAPPSPARERPGSPFISLIPHLYLPTSPLYRPYLPYISSTQAQRSGGFAVGQRVVSLNGHALGDGVSFDQLLSTVAVGTPVIVEVSMPADRVSSCVTLQTSLAV